MQTLGAAPRPPTAATIHPTWTVRSTPVRNFSAAKRARHWAGVLSLGALRPSPGVGASIQHPHVDASLRVLLRAYGGFQRVLRGRRGSMGHHRGREARARRLLPCAAYGRNHNRWNDEMRDKLAKRAEEQRKRIQRRRSEKLESKPKVSEKQRAATERLQKGSDTLREARLRGAVAPRRAQRAAPPPDASEGLRLAQRAQRADQKRQEDQLRAELERRRAPPQRPAVPRPRPGSQRPARPLQAARAAPPAVRPPPPPSKRMGKGQARAMAQADELERLHREYNAQASQEAEWSAGKKAARRPTRATRAILRRRYDEDYHRRFVEALDAELEEEKAQLQQRIRRWPLRKLVEEGYALLELRVAKREPFYDEFAFTFHRPGHRALPSTLRFSAGDVVVINHGRDYDEDTPMQGTVVERLRTTIRVSFNRETARTIGMYRQEDAAEWGPEGRRGSEAGGQWRMDFAANSVAVSRMKHALLAFNPDAVEASEGSDFDSYEKGKDKKKAEPVPKVAFQELLPVLGIPGLDSRVQEMASARPSWWKDMQWRAKVKEGMSRVQANPSQKQAIKNAIQYKLCLWQGPPGTGKTRTLVEFLKLITRLKMRTLAVSDSNQAVDNLVRGMDEQGISVVRVGSPAAVHSDLRHLTLEAKAQAHPRGMEAARIRHEQGARERQLQKTIEEDRQGERRLSRQMIHDARDELREDSKKAVALMKQAEEAVLFQASVVACTCVTAGSRLLAPYFFQVCVVDEATQATEPATLLPMTRGIETMLLVGDTCQLPPTVISGDEAALPLNTSLFERLQASGVQPQMLDTQYRMHPALCAFPSQAFYGGLLKTAKGLEANRVAPRGFPWPDPSKPLAFIDLPSSQETSTAENNSYSNAAEAARVVTVVQALLAAGLAASDIGVVTPYRGQVQELTQQCSQAGIAISRGASAGEGGQAEALLEVKTIDGFQGSEKEVIIISTVRANSRGQVGFLKDERRLNVAITRARRGMIVVGNSRVLSNDPTWGDWLQHIQSCDPSLRIDGEA